MELIAGPPALETGARLTIDLSALAANWQFLARHVEPAECAAVVKADAYGLGIAPAGRALWDAGARTFFVAHLTEARALRAALPAATIYVLGGLNPGSAPLYREIEARPVLGSLEEIAEWADAARGICAGCKAAIHIDTGMNRLGLSLAEASEVAVRLAAGTLGFTPCLVMSHLACADTPDNPLDARQLERFREAAAQFPGIPASLANSAATLEGGDFRFDLCRPGIALYGGAARGGVPETAPVVRLEARVIQVRDGAVGETVGYGATQTLARASRIAVLSLGYADGVLRAASSSDTHPGASVLLNGARCPLIGRISMDLVAVDVTDVSPPVQRGDRAVLLGDGIGVDELARHAGTIGYEVLTSLGHRYQRIYVGK